MKQPDGGFAPSYNVQIDTDANNGVVVAVGVVQAGNDFEQLEPGIDRVQHNLGETPKEVVTDGGFVSRDTIVAMKEREIEYIAPCVDEAGKGQSSYDSRGVSAEYQSSQFIYDAQSNSYRCPQGKILSYEGKEERHLQLSYRYRAQRSDCAGCPMKSRCCPGNRVTGRSVHRSEELAEVAEFRQKMHSESKRARSTKLEPKWPRRPIYGSRRSLGYASSACAGYLRWGWRRCGRVSPTTSACGYVCAGDKRSGGAACVEKKGERGSCSWIENRYFENCFKSGSTPRLE